MLAGAGPSERARLREYGLQLGMAFQLADDMLDFVSDEATLGKPVLNDLREGKLSIPAIHALRVGGPDVKRLLEAVITDRGFQRASAEDVVRAVRETGGLDATADFARDAARRARESLTGFKDGLPLAALRFATEYAVTRTF